MIPNVCPWFFRMFDKILTLCQFPKVSRMLCHSSKCIVSLSVVARCFMLVGWRLFYTKPIKAIFIMIAIVISLKTENKRHHISFDWWIMCPNTPQNSSNKIVFDSKNRPLLGRQLQAFRWARATLLLHLLRKIGMEASDSEGWMEFSSKVGRLGHISHGFREIRKALDPLHHQSEIWSAGCFSLHITHVAFQMEFVVPWNSICNLILESILKKSLRPFEMSRCFGLPWMMHAFWIFWLAEVSRISRGWNPERSSFHIKGQGLAPSSRLNENENASGSSAFLQTCRSLQQVAYNWSAWKLPVHRRI